MQKTIIGMAGSYTVAQAIVEALEREGIVGTQVQVISGAEDDVSSLDNSAADHRPSLAERIRNAFRSHSHPGDKAVHDIMSKIRNSTPLTSGKAAP